MLITGAAHRIGRRLALEFAAKGWSLAIHYNSSGNEALDLVTQIEEAGGRAAAFAADLADLKAVERLIPACTSKLGSLTCLINNASAFEHDDIGTLTGAGWDRHLAINLRAPVFLAKAFAAQLPPAIEDGEVSDVSGPAPASGPPPASGNVINLIDQRVWNLNPDFFSYTISKAGLWTATQTLAQALAPRVRVNAIAPGPVLKSVHQTPGQFDRERASTPLGRGTSPGEIAQAIGFILDAPAMTGQMIALDGGQHLSWRPH